ncbi:concanavalin A-like lectin/glucanase [Massarina eburnea CBS 473.64]|uniref:chitinase n=1 Tax=Massarina eburnea CBS 473.64 TaxID=1395130 RepID=A0A6A6RRR1_9PLEO|nr:concanavalin A-like lectin/glucanase [Massarina eburnea CBS 473.64]
MYAVSLSAVALLASLLPTTFAQTTTACQPLNTTGCPNMEALGGNVTLDFESGYNVKIWQKPNAGEIKGTGENGTAFILAKSGDSPSLHSNFYLFFGRMEISEDLDEIDWEFLGSNNTHLFTNYYGKGNLTMGDRGYEYPVDESPFDDFHNYTIDWTKERMQWIYDDKVIREVKFDDALPGGKNYPQTPMNIRMGCWAAGDMDKNAIGVVEWAGGSTDFDQGPFNMLVKSVYAKDYTSAKEYSWEDMDSSGTWEKVTVIGKDEVSDIYKEITKAHGVDRWKALSTTAKIAILASVGGVLAVGACIFAFCCVRQRNAGRKEYAAFQAQQNQEAADFETHKEQWANRSSKYARL